MKKNIFKNNLSIDFWEPAYQFLDLLGFKHINNF